MMTIGFPISHKENERRRAIVPMHLENIKHTDMLYVEQGYGNVLGYDDSEYEKYGVHICTHEEALSKDVICDPKVGDADYLDKLHNQTVFGWLHAVQNRDITDKLLNGRLSGIAWEDDTQNINDGYPILAWQN